MDALTSAPRTFSPGMELVICVPPIVAFSREPMTLLAGSVALFNVPVI